MENKIDCGTRYCVFVWNKLKIFHKILITLVNVVGPLLIGAFIYIMLVPSAWVSKLIYSFVGTNLNLEITVEPGSFITCYMADCLWAYALFFLLGAIQIECFKDLIVVLSECFLFEIIIETLQLMGVFSGTFDGVDIIFEILSTVFAYIIWIFITTTIGRKKRFILKNINKKVGGLKS